MENPFEEQPHRIQRPTFLSVLCILTFIGSGWGVLSNLFSLFTADLLNSTVQMEQYSSMMDGMNAGETLSNYLSSAMTTLQETFVHAREIHVMSLVLSIVSLLGAILMFRLRKFGFYLYTTAQILILFVVPYFVGFNFYVLSTLFASGIFSLLFIILYAVNLKHMQY